MSNPQNSRNISIKHFEWPIPDLSPTRENFTGSSKKCCCSGIRVCTGVTSIFFIIFLAVLIILFLTLLKPKEPKIVSQPVTLENYDLLVSPDVHLNVTLGLFLTINNRNYGSFKYHDGVAYVSYHGDLVAEAPIHKGSIPARGRHNISSLVTVLADKLIGNSNFMGDYSSGVLNFSASTTLHGKLSMLKYFKMKATGHSSCDISIFVQNKSINSDCKSNVIRL